MDLRSIKFFLTVAEEGSIPGRRSGCISLSPP